MANQLGCASIANGVIGVACGNVPAVGTIGGVALFNYNQVNQGAANEGSTAYNILYPAFERTLRELPTKVMPNTNPAENYKGYFFESVDDALTGEVSLNAGTYFNTWQHQIILRLFTKDEAAKRFVDSMRNGRVIAVVENRDWGLNNLTPADYSTTGGGAMSVLYTDMGTAPQTRPSYWKEVVDNSKGTTKFEIYGLNSGLILTEATISTEMADGVVYQLTMANGTAKESRLPISLCRIASTDDSATNDGSSAATATTYVEQVDTAATIEYLNSIVYDGKFGNY